MVKFSRTKNEISGCTDACAIAKDMLQKGEITEKQYDEVWRMSQFIALHIIEPIYKHDCHCIFKERNENEQN